MSSVRPSPLTAREALLAWYDAHRRDLPWRRRQGDAYAVWVSEIMLQQTRVETVVPYYERFMARFPDVRALAGASEDEVLAHWSGLGYYRRARLLHHGVREVVERYGGEIPEAASDRRTLPGIGRYTAGAIGSIAFGKEEAIVDGNVARVMSRLYGIDTPLGEKTTERALWSRVAECARGPRPGDLNQALMELGASRCKKARPECEGCPLGEVCFARANGRQDSLPIPRPRKKPICVQMSAVVVTDREGALLLARAEGSLFAGLYGPPLHKGHDRSAARAALRAHRVEARLEREPVAAIEHVLTHRRLDVRVWRARAIRFDTEGTLRLVAPAGLLDVGLSTFARRVIEAAS